MRHNRQITAALLTGILLAAVISPASEFSAYGAWNKVDGAYQMIDGSAIDGVYARGIDVSHWKETIDWSAVAADDVQFAILGTSYKRDVDPYFRANAENAVKAGVRIGAYIYSYATTPEMAVQEADFVLNLVKDYPISYPIAFDVEDNSTLGTLSKTELNDIINAFCGRIAEAGYHPMVYANDYWLTNKIDTSLLKYDVWVARYEKKHTFANPAMWQATSTGAISGVKGNVDINFQYKDFTPNTPPDLWRTIGGKTYYYKNYAMQKESWIEDGTGWYYMDGDGLASKGWKEMNGSKYYLDDTTGRMATGWKSFDNGWHYFKNDGPMATGWIEDGGAKYHLNDQGIMSTGWKNDGGSTYYLTNNGSAAKGWLSLDNAWYYFDPSFKMTKGWTDVDGSWYCMDDEGKMKTSWMKEGNTTYYLSTSSGKMTTGWREVDGSWYYFDGSGAMATGLLELDGKKYYLNPSDGRMAVNTTILADGTEYTADGSGVCTTPTPQPPAESTGTPADDGGSQTVTPSDGPEESTGTDSGAGVKKGPGE